MRELNQSSVPVSKRVRTLQNPNYVAEASIGIVQTNREAFTNEGFKLPLELANHGTTINLYFNIASGRQNRLESASPQSEKLEAIT